MASRNYLIVTIILASLMTGLSPVMAQTESGSVFDAPSDYVDISDFEVAELPISFTVESEDPETYSGDVTFVAQSDQPIEVPLAVFVYTADKSLVKTISMKAALSGSRWKADWMSNELPNGRYVFSLGYRLLRGAEPVILHRGYWAAILNSEAVIPTEPLPTQPEFPKDPEIILPLQSTSTPTTTEPLLNVITPQESIDNRVTDFCLRNSITIPESCQTVERFRLNPLCRGEHATSQKECVDYLQTTYEIPLCQGVASTDDTTCSSYLLEQAQAKNICGQWPALACAMSIGSFYHADVASYLRIMSSLELAFRPIMQQTIDLKAALERVDLNQIVSKVIPLELGEHNPFVRFIPLKSGAIIDANQDWQMVWSAGLQFDGDNDGLPDDAELRYGTKLDVVDTDSDGYLDGEELQHHYNPAGSGKLPGAIAGIDQALIDGLSIEQPWTAGEVGTKVTISQVSAFVDGQGLHLQGTGPALQPVTLFVGQPLPLVMTVLVDEQGRWDYYLRQPLRDGAYMAYATMINDQGTILTKSKPTELYWYQGQLVSLQQIASGQPIVKGVAYDRFGITTPLAIGLVVATIIVGATLLVVSWRRW